MTDYNGALFDDEMFARQLAEEHAAIETLRELGYDNPEETLFYLRTLELRDERGQT